MALAVFITSLEFRMVRLLRKFLLNFWIWWYIVQNKQTALKLAGYWGFSLGYLNVVPMLTNLFTPLFQDYTNIGRLIAFPIRLTWVIGGSVIQLIITVPLITMYLVYLALPVLVVIMIASYFVPII